MKIVLILLLLTNIAKANKIDMNTVTKAITSTETIKTASNAINKEINKTPLKNAAFLYPLLNQSINFKYDKFQFKLDTKTKTINVGFALNF